MILRASPLSRVSWLARGLNGNGECFVRSRIVATDADRKGSVAAPDMGQTTAVLGRRLSPGAEQGSDEVTPTPMSLAGSPTTCPLWIIAIASQPAIVCDADL